MKANIHTPERLAGESMEAYRERRSLSQLRANPARFVHVNGRNGPWRNSENNQRRRNVAYAGGIRQYKKARRDGIV